MDEESPIASISPTTGAGEETYKSGEQEELSLLASISPIAGISPATGVGEKTSKSGVATIIMDHCETPPPHGDNEVPPYLPWYSLPLLWTAGVKLSDLGGF